MRFFRWLRRYNQIVLAIALTSGLVVAAAIAFEYWRLESARQHYRDTSISQSDVGGEEIETSDGVITVYKVEVGDTYDGVRDVRYVSMRTGKIVRLSDDPAALIYSERPVGDIGRAALIETGKRDGRSVFDFVFVSFPELDRSVVARGIDALDTTQALDDNTFSAVIWSDLERARFIIVDARTGSIKASRPLDFSESRRSAPSALSPAEEAAPHNSFD